MDRAADKNSVIRIVMFYKHVGKPTYQDYSWGRCNRQDTGMCSCSSWPHIDHHGDRGAAGSCSPEDNQREALEGRCQDPRGMLFLDQPAWNLLSCSEHNHSNWNRGYRSHEYI